MVDLMTKEGAALLETDAQPWNIYPRPQMRREGWLNLNGEWDFTVTRWEDLPDAYDRTIRVPFCTESKLSGIGAHFPENSALTYRKVVRLPEGFRRGRVLLHVGAADQISAVYVNRVFLGGTVGGYQASAYDITEALAAENEIIIQVRDDLTKTDMPYGKQTLKRGGMWYTPVSGIWQSVWLESVPEIYIEKLHIENRGASVVISVEPAQEGTVSVKGLGDFALANGRVTITPENPHFWSPEDPYLYDFTVTAGEDSIESYFAIRTLEIKKVGAYQRLCLNGKPYFFHGLLDQGYWPDGLLTPPGPRSYEDDICNMKKTGLQYAAQAHQGGDGAFLLPVRPHGHDRLPGHGQQRRLQLCPRHCAAHRLPDVSEAGRPDAPPGRADPGDVPAGDGSHGEATAQSSLHLLLDHFQRGLGPV